MPNRYWPLIDEVKAHVFQWASEDGWRRLPPNVNAALTQLMNELKVHEACERAGVPDERLDDTPEKRRKVFIAIFEKKYLELTDLNYSRGVSPVERMAITRAIDRLMSEGAAVPEYLEWFFDDFCSLESSKKFLPPSINFTCSGTIIDKFLYQMKDSLRMRKKEMSMMGVRTGLLEICVALAGRHVNRDFSKKLKDFSAGKVTVTKMMSVARAYAMKCDDREAVSALEKFNPEEKDGQV